MLFDLRERECCEAAVEGMDQVWNLATDMGGIGYLSANKLEPMRSVLINTHLLEAAAQAGVERYLFTSSACVYGEGTDTREENAYPADCEDGYGWEKLFSERMCRHYTEERGLRPGWRGSTTSTARMVPGTMAARRRRRRCAARWPRP